MSVTTKSQEKKPTVSTNYAALEKAQVVPVEATNRSYKEAPRSGPYRDISSHTKLIPSADTFIEYANPNKDSGGSFLVLLKRATRPWAGWKKLAEAGVEISDVTCDVCQKPVLLHPQHLLQHMNTHQGSNRRNKRGGHFRVTFSMDQPIPAAEEALLEDGTSEYGFTE